MEKERGLAGVGGGQERVIGARDGDDGDGGGDGGGTSLLQKNVPGKSSSGQLLVAKNYCGCHLLENG